MKFDDLTTAGSLESTTENLSLDALVEMVEKLKGSVIQIDDPWLVSREDYEALRARLVPLSVPLVLRPQYGFQAFNMVVSDNYKGPPISLCKKDE